MKESVGTLRAQKGTAASEQLSVRRSSCVPCLSWQYCLVLVCS